MYHNNQPIINRTPIVNQSSTNSPFVKIRSPCRMTEPPVNDCIKVKSQCNNQFTHNNYRLALTSYYHSIIK